jgi:hypothetical protein
VNESCCPGRRVWAVAGPVYFTDVTLPAVPHAVGLAETVQVIAFEPANDVGAGQVLPAVPAAERPEIVIVTELPIVIADVPVFFRVRESEFPALAIEIPVRVTLDWAEEELIRPLTLVATTPPAARTAAIMMNRSMLCEMARRLRSIFIDVVGRARI